jgi:hypothetical protein
VVLNIGFPRSRKPASDSAELSNKKFDSVAYEELGKLQGIAPQSNTRTVREVKIV